MIIARLELDEFAGLTDFSLDLTEGINVFYGVNGAGKTTLGLFIRTMLYGVGNDRKRDDVTLRMRILPIGAQKASGRMTIEVAGRRLEIARSFGRTKKYDRISMIWLDDGSRLDLSNEPGENFLDLNEETFSRTFFVGEMNHSVQPGTTGELASRLMNLSVTGHENMDYHQAVKKLKDEVRSITNQRGSGRLDELNRQKSVIAEHTDRVRNLMSDLNALRDQLEADQAKKSELIREMEKLRLQSDSLDQLKELEDYEQAMLLLAKKADLEERIQKIKIPLGLTEGSRLKGQLEEFLAEESRLGQRVDRHNEETGDLAKLEAGFSAEFDRLFHPSNESIVREYLSEKETLDANISLFKRLTPEESIALKNGLDELRKNRRKILLLGSLWIWMIPTVFLILSASFGLASANYGIIMAGAIVSLILAYALQKFKKSRLGSLLQQDQAGMDTLQKLWENEAGVRFMTILNDDPDFSPSDAMQQWEAQYQTLIVKVKSLGLEMVDLFDYLKEQVQYSNQKSLWHQRLAQLEINHGTLAGEADQLAIKRENLTRQLAPMNLDCDKESVSNLEYQISQFTIRQTEETELERTMAQLKKLSEDRNLNPILLEPQKHRKEGVRRELDIQRQIIRETDQVGAEISDLDIQMAKEEAQIENIAGLLAFDTKEARSIEKVDEEIEQSGRRHRILELALENLEASYRTIQRDYLPRVSYKVSETFKELTGGKFDQVQLSGDYRMKIPLGGELSSMEYLSRGNLDLLWLGLRLSLCAIIIRGEKAPLIFDDSFLHLDEERLKNVLRYLSERIDGQIIILTCHHRETRLLNEMDLL